MGRAQPSAKVNNNTLSDILNGASLGDHGAIVAIRMAAQNMAVGIDSVLSLFASEAVMLTCIVGHHDVCRMAVVEALHAIAGVYTFVRSVLVISDHRMPPCGWRWQLLLRRI